MMIGPDADTTFYAMGSDGTPTIGGMVTVNSLTAARVYTLQNAVGMKTMKFSLWSNGSTNTLRLNRIGGTEIITLQNGVAGQSYSADLVYDQALGWQVFDVRFLP